MSSRDNILTMRKHAPAAIISMPPRPKAVVLHMPSHWRCTEQHPARVIVMPTRIDCAEAHAEAKTEETLHHLPAAVRMALLALLAWFGWPRPTHGKDPGAAAAKPWKPALLNLISTLHLPLPALTPRRAAAILELPLNRGVECDSTAA